MSQFPIFSPKLDPYLNRSTTTKQAPLFLPNLNLTQDDIKREREQFLGFLNNTIEGDTFTSMSLVDHHYEKTMGEFHKLRENWYNQANNVNPNKIDKDLSSWRLDRTDQPLLSITVEPEGFGVFQPRKLATGKDSWDTTDYFTFAGSSTWGTLLNQDASAPMFTELLGRNAQTNHFAAIRARGGREGELWKNVTAKNPWLNKMFTESETVKESLDSWIDSTPTLFNVKASIPFSAYAGETVLDILNNADTEVPEDWDPKKAIEELTTTDPILTDILFKEMGIKKERLAELSTNPLKFKFFIADAIDNYAYTRYLAEYSQSAGGFTNFANTMAWPLVRESFNSNDNFSELMAVGAGIALSAGSVGTAGTTLIPGIASAVSGIGSFVLKPLRITLKASKAFDRYETMSRAFATAGKINKTIWQARKVLPSNITDTVFDATGLTRKFFTAPAQAGRTRKVLTYGLKQFVGEGAQGVLESVVSQSEYMENGLQSRFSIGDVGYNALEEGVGGLLLGGSIRTIGRTAESLSTTQVGAFVNRKISEAKTKTISAVTAPISPTASKNIRLATSIMLGIPDGVDFDTYANAIETELRLTAVLDRVSKTTKFGDILTPGDMDDPLLVGLVRVLTRGNASQDFGARVELLRRIDSAIDKTTDSKTGKSNLSSDDVEALFFLTGMSQSENDPASKTQLIEALWLSKQYAAGVKTNKDNKPLSAADMTEDDIKQTAADIDTKIQSFVTKLGAKSSEEVDIVFGRSIGQKEQETLQSVVQEAQEELNKAETPTSVNIGMGNLPLEGTIPNQLTTQVAPEVVPSKPPKPTIKDMLLAQAKTSGTPEAAQAAPEAAQETKDTFSSETFEMLARPGDTITFIYEGGSTPGKRRKVKIISRSKPGYFRAIDLETNEEREFKYDRVSKKGIQVLSTEYESKLESEAAQAAPEAAPEATQTVPEAVPEVVTPKSSVATLTESILEGLDKPDATADSDITLTPEEEENLRSRTCYIERD